MIKSLKFQRNVIYFLGLFAFLILLISGPGSTLFFEKSTLDTAALNCNKANSCESLAVANKREIQTSLLNIDADIRFPSSLEDNSLIKPNIDAIGWVDEEGITLHAVRSNWLYIKIPMRNSDGASFNYVLKDVQPKDVVTIRMTKSNSIYILKNGKIAYTHRYQEPVFYYPLTEPIKVANVPSSIVQIHSASYSSANLGVSVLKIFGLFSVMFLFALLPLLIFRFRRFSKSLQEKKGNQVGSTKFVNLPSTLFLTLWVLSLGAWVGTYRGQTTSAGKSPFGPSAPYFSDFFQVAQFGLYQRPFDLVGIDYPPSAVMLFGVLLRLFGDISFFILMGLSLGLVFASLFGMFQSHFFENRSDKLKIFLWMPILFYPLVFGVLRGNIDILVCGLVILSVACMQLEREKFAVIFLALAISFKIWPVAFLLIFMKRRKIYAAASTILLSLIPSLIALIYLGYTNSSEWIKVFLLPYLRGDYSISQSFQYNYSFKTLVYFWHLLTFASKPEEIGKSDIANSMRFISGINYIAILMALAAILLAGVYWSKNFATIYVLICGLVLLVPSPTYTYRALIIAPYVLFKLIQLSQGHLIGKKKKGKKTKEIRLENQQSEFSNKIVVIALSCICAPVTFVFFGDSSVSIGSIAQPIALISLILLEVKSEASQRRTKKEADTFSNVAWAGIEPAT